MGALSAPGQPKYHQGVGPMLAGFSYAPFGDLDAARKLIDDEACAILIEPIQGEGGIHLPPDGYLAGLRRVGRPAQADADLRRGTKPAWGRTGTWYAFQQFGVEPDAVTTGQGAGRRRCLRRLARETPIRRQARPWNACGDVSAATRSPAPPRSPRSRPSPRTGCCRGPRKSARRFARRFAALQARCPLIQEIRVLGTMIGVELSVDGAPIVDQCLQRRLLINCTHGNVLRLFAGF